MFVPLHDGVPMRFIRVAYVTYALIVICIVLRLMLMYWTSEFSDPANHVSAGALTLLAGSAGGYFNTGRHIDYNIHAQNNPNTLQYDTNESTHNLYTSFLQAFGGTDTHFGSNHAKHQGPLPGLV